MYNYHGKIGTRLTSGGLGRNFLPGKLVKGPSQKDPLNPKTQSKEWTITLGPTGKFPGIPVFQSATAWFLHTDELWVFFNHIMMVNFYWWKHQECLKNLTTSLLHESDKLSHEVVSRASLHGHESNSLWWRQTLFVQILSYCYFTKYQYIVICQWISG